MGQNLFALSISRIGGSCFIQFCRIGFRFLRPKFYPWIVLAIVPFRIATSSGIDRTYAKIHYWRAMTRINFVAVCKLLDDLLW
jgi:hypothetical protein